MIETAPTTRIDPGTPPFNFREHKGTHLCPSLVSVHLCASCFQINWSNLGRIAHVSPTLRVVTQETYIPCCL
ncbi:unnamed protein product [Clavelina lepadiformis]|uniref:Uncharacterized protein n=1 Tax=Clavelina lepadiformis TaxID=159417 RepID=A0ABP0G8W3_CLALP